MMRTHPHSNRWSSGSVMGIVPPDKPTEFEEKVKRLGLSGKPEKIVTSHALKFWAEENRAEKYVPEWLLIAWGMELYESDVNWII